MDTLRVNVEGWTKRIPAIDRLLAEDDIVASSREYLFCDFGFRSEANIESSYGVYSVSSLVGLNGGLIVGNCDSGKTVVLEMLERTLKSKGKRYALLRMRDMNRSLRNLKSLLAKPSCDYMLIDGVDEYPECVDSLVQAIEVSNPSVRWFVTSRPILELNRFNDLSERIPRLSILPFGYTEAMGLVKELVGSEVSFFSKVNEIGLLEFCTQPGGLISLVRVFRDERQNNLTVSNILNEVAKVYCKQRQDKSKVDGQINGSVKNCARCFDILGWMATCLVLTRNDELWLSDTSKSPKGALPLRGCITDRYGYDDLFAVLSSRAIEPMGRNRARFSYSPLLGYCAAAWLNNNVSLRNASALLRVVAPRQEVNILETQLWLSRLNPDYKPQDMERAPEFFLRSKAAISDIGIEKYYNLLEQRYGQLTFDERQNRIVCHLPILNDFVEFGPIVLKKLTDKASSFNCLEFASVVARKCKLRLCLAALVDLVLDESQPDRLRSSISYNLPWLKEAFPEADEFIGLVNIENYPFRSVEHSNIIGNTLDCLWPRYITASDLCRWLQRPYQKGYFGAYERFIEYSLPSSFQDHINKSAVLPLLKWAKSHIAEDRPFDRLGRLAREIFTYAWKWVGDKIIASAMIDCLASYIKARHHCQMPFVYNEPGEGRYKWLVTPKKYAYDAQRRISFLKAVIEDNRFSENDLERFGAWYEDFPLYYSVDFDVIYLQWLEVRNSAKPIADRWAVVLGQIAMRQSGQVDKGALKILSEAYPQNRNFDREWLEEQREKWEQLEVRQQEEKERQSRENIAQSNAVIEKIKNLLQQKDDAGIKFINIAYLMPSTDGRPDLPTMDVTATENYKRLDEVHRRALLTAAKSTLVELSNDIIKSGSQCCAIISAIVFVWIKDRKFFEVLSGQRIGLLSKSIFDSCGMIDNVTTADEIISNFIERNRNGCFAALQDTLLKDVKRGLSIGRTLSLWKLNLTQDEVNGLIKSCRAENLDGNGMGQLLERLATVNGGRDAVKAYFKKSIPLMAKQHPDEVSASMLFYALKVFPREYGKLLLGLSKNHSGCMKEWILSVADHVDETVIAGAMLKNGQKAAFKFFGWLERNFPEDKRPIHEAVYSPSATDNVYEIKDLVLANLMNNCNAETLVLLNTLPKLFPRRQWDYLLIRCRSKVENDAIPEAIPLEELKRIPIEARKEKSASKGNVAPALKKRIRRVVRDGADLKDAVLEAITKYDESYLRGWDFAAIPDIWNYFRRGMVVKSEKDRGNDMLTCPKQEGALSDHLARYLDNVLNGNNEVVITRESQSGPAVPVGTVGARKSAYHDITIQHPKTKSKVVVEVKGNWNKDLGGAGLVDQLNGNYLKRNRTAYGILVCGCYSSDCWCKGDWRHKAVKGFETKEEAQKSLNSQLANIEDRSRISVVAIDCGWHV